MSPALLSPESLEHVHHDMRLPEIPHDPFADRTLNYSRDRAVVWSVGPGGAGDSGDPPADMVWNVATA
jgi:hypothetical protein